jgi:hypothetical protein
MMRLSEELLYALVQHLNIDGDRNTLVALLTTSRVLSDAALDIPWTMPDLWMLAVNVMLWGELSGERSGVREYAPGSNGVAERCGDPVGV